MSSVTYRMSASLSNRRGAMLAFVAVSMVGLLGVLAITIDVGAGNRERRMAQTAADAAALGGGNNILRGHDAASVIAAAQYSATLNHFASGVTVRYPPDTGVYAGNDDFIEVQIDRTIPTRFGSIFNKPTLQIQARAVAGAAAWSNYCIIGLAPSGNAIDLPNGTQIEATNCSVASNSGIDAFNIDARSIAAVGAVDIHQTGSSVVRSGVPPTLNPFAHLVIPAETSCDHTNFTVSANVTLDSGVYCGGITINANRRATLRPGTYILRGGGINASGNGAELYGPASGTAPGGVTIINTAGPGGNMAAFRPIVFGNTCYVTLHAPTSGDYRGIVIFTDPNAPSTGPYSENEFCGKGLEAGPDIRGVIYMPSQTFRLVNANGKFELAGTIVANRVEAENGGGRFFIRSDDSGNSGFKRLSLVR